MCEYLFVCVFEDAATLVHERVLDDSNQLRVLQNRLMSQTGIWAKITLTKDPMLMLRRSLDISRGAAKRHQLANVIRVTQLSVYSYKAICVSCCSRVSHDCPIRIYMQCGDTI